MKKVFLFLLLIYILLLSGACKSKAPPLAPEPPSNIQPTVPVSPAVTQPAPTQVNPATQPPGVSETKIGSRHQSGVILDGALSYTVIRGDTLTEIARRFYQDGSYYPLIMMVSSGISDIDKIYPNMQLTIPNLMTNMNDPAARESINRYFLQIANLEDQRGRRQTAALIRSHVR